MSIDSEFPNTIHSEMYCPECDQSYPGHETVCPKDQSSLVELAIAAPVSMIGRVLNGRYRLDSELGDGGMGVVYRATQLALDREVAIKLIRREFTAKPEVSKRFLRESRISGKLSHPNIVNIQEMGRSDEGELYLVMEILRGRSLAEVLLDEGRMDPHRAAWIASQICEALVPAHSQDIVHRDLKPGNIMILDDPPGRDFVKVLDFGLAKSLTADTTVTQSGSLVGTPSYMPPEMLLEAQVDARCDLYSVGVILYEMVSGRLPFHAETMPALLLKQAHDPPEPLPDDIPPAMASIITTLLAKNPDDRYRSALEAKDAIEMAVTAVTGSFNRFPTVQTGETYIGTPSIGTPPIETPPIGTPSIETPPPPANEAPEPRRKQWALPAFLLVACVAVATAIVVKRGGTSAPPPQSTTGPAQPSHTNAMTTDPKPPGEPPDPEIPSPTQAEPDPTEPIPPLGEQLAAPATSLPESEVPAAATLVSIDLRSNPRATIFLNGQDRGRTPQVLDIAQSDTPVKIVLRRKGFRPETFELTPDSKQQIEKTLRRKRKGTNSGRHGGSDESNLPF